MPRHQTVFVNACEVPVRPDCGESLPATPSDVSQAERSFSYATFCTMPAEVCSPELLTLAVAAEKSAISSALESLPGGIVDAVRSDDPERQPVDRQWFNGACRASLQECETVVTLAARQVAAGDETSHEYQRLKEIASHSVSLIAASLRQLSQPTALSADTWRATAEACEAVAAEADDFPFDGWVSRCGEGCRQLAEVSRRASLRGLETPCTL